MTFCIDGTMNSVLYPEFIFLCDFFLFSRVCLLVNLFSGVSILYFPCEKLQINSYLHFLAPVSILHYHTLPSIICMAQVGIPTFTFWQDTSGGSLLSTMAKSLVSVDASRKAGPGCFGCRGWGCRGQQAALDAGVEAVAWLPSPSQLGQV